MMFRCSYNNSGDVYVQASITVKVTIGCRFCNDVVLFVRWQSNDGAE